MGELIFKKLYRDVSQEEFNCGNDSINRLIYNSYYPTLLQHGYAYEVSDRESHTVLGYYMIKFRSIKLEHCPKEVSEYFCDLINDCCALHITYIAVDKKYQGHRLGTHIMLSVIRTVRDMCQRFPVRLITIDALKDKCKWYQGLGFEMFDPADAYNESTTVKMYIDCVADRSAIQEYVDEEAGI